MICIQGGKDPYNEYAGVPSAPTGCVNNMTGVKGRQIGKSLTAIDNDGLSTVSPHLLCGKRPYRMKLESRGWSWMDLKHDIFDLWSR